MLPLRQRPSAAPHRSPPRYIALLHRLADPAIVVLPCQDLTFLTVPLRYAQHRLHIRQVAPLRRNGLRIGSRVAVQRDLSLQAHQTTSCAATGQLCDAAKIDVLTDVANETIKVIK